MRIILNRNSNVLTIYTLIFALVINVVEVPQHLDRAYMGAGIVHDSLAAVLNQVFKQLQSLVYLSPLAGFFLHEAGIDARHDFIEVLEVECAVQ